MFTKARVLFALCLLALALGAGVRATLWAPLKDPLPGFPKLILWAWEQPQDLRFLDPSKTAVAYLAASLFVQSNSAVAYRPRFQPMRIAPGTKLIAVVRIENRPGFESDPEALARNILQPSILRDASALQIDYDAVRSERANYSRLLHLLRQRMPPQLPLTMTALVSWCTGDNWLDALPIADAIPMYFRMGPEYRLQRLPLRAKYCGYSTGLSTDEAMRVPIHQRLFLFSPRPWTPENLNDALYALKRRS